MMSNVTRTRRFCAIMIMRNDGTLDLDNHASLVHNHHLDLHLDVHDSRSMSPRRDYSRLCMYSRDRSRRT